MTKIRVMKDVFYLEAPEVGLSLLNECPEFVIKIPI
jgi:hypothetical protein